MVLGAWVAVTIATQFLGTELTNASQGSLLTVLTPIFAVVLGASVLGERVTRAKAAGVVLAAVGTVVVLAGQYDLTGIAAGNAAGVALLVLASLAWAGYTVWGVAVVRKYGALTAATYSAIAATPMLFVLAVVELAVVGRGVGSIPLSAGFLFAVAYLGLASTAAAWYLWYKGLEHVPAGTVAVFFFSSSRSSASRSARCCSANRSAPRSPSGASSSEPASGSSAENAPPTPGATDHVRTEPGRCCAARRRRFRFPCRRVQGSGTSTSAFSAADFTVLYSSMARVIGPTPPGTGVMAPATSFAES